MLMAELGDWKQQHGEIGVFVPTKDLSPRSKILRKPIEPTARARSAQDNQPGGLTAGARGGCKMAIAYARKRINQLTWKGFCKGRGGKPEGQSDRARTPQPLHAGAGLVTRGVTKNKNPRDPITGPGGFVKLSRL